MTLTPTQVRRIIHLAEMGYGRDRIARWTDCSSSAVKRVMQGRTYKTITGGKPVTKGKTRTMQHIGWSGVAGCESPEPKARNNEK